MNTENILKIADLIEAGCILSLDVGFNLESYIAEAGTNRKDQTGHSCGTVACIAGYATIQKRLEDGVQDKQDLTSNYFIGDEQRYHDVSIAMEYTSSFEIARKYLEISFAQAEALFIPSIDINGLDLSTIKPEQAVKVLRDLAETGEVHWLPYLDNDNMDDFHAIEDGVVVYMVDEYKEEA